MPKRSEKSTNSEQKIWEDIFSYIKRNIFNYTEEQKSGFYADLEKVEL